MDDIESPIYSRYQSSEPGLPKHARLRTAIVEAVESGDLRVGTKLMGERDLSRLLNVSLGTTQKALGRLMVEGFLVRKQGHGTFVGSARQPLAGSWHYRFRADDGSELPVYSTLIDRKLVRTRGIWSQALGADDKGYVMLLRQLDIGGKFNCSSHMYLPASRFGTILRIAEKRLADANLKLLLGSHFAAPTLSSDGLAHVIQISTEDAKVIGVPRQTYGLQVDIVGRTFGRVPITFQQMIVPPAPCGLMLDFKPPTAE